MSPSKLEAFEQSALDWFIDSVSGTQSSTAMGLGTIVHWAMETATDPAVDSIWESIESRWNELVFESPWLAEQQRRAAPSHDSTNRHFIGSGRDRLEIPEHMRLAVFTSLIDAYWDMVSSKAN